MQMFLVIFLHSKTIFKIKYICSYSSLTQHLTGSLPLHTQLTLSSFSKNKNQIEQQNPSKQRKQNITPPKKEKKYNNHSLTK